MKKLITLLLTLTVLSSASVNVYSVTEESIIDNEEIIEDYEYANNVLSSISNSGKTGTCKSTIIAKSSVSKIVVTQKMQKKSGDSWTTVSKWEKNYSASTAVYSNTKSSLSSGTYRTRTVAKVYKGSNYETVSANSSTVKI